MTILGKNIDTLKELHSVYESECNKLNDVSSQKDYIAVTAKIAAIVTQMTCVSNAINSELAEMDKLNSVTIPEGQEPMQEVICDLVAELYPIAKPNTKKK